MKQTTTVVFALIALMNFTYAEEKLKTRQFYLDYVEYDDRVYSQNKKTELGEQVELDAAFKYFYNESTWGRMRFETFPEENTYDNKTSRLELLGHHQYDNLVIQLDLELNGNDESSGATSIGVDRDSEHSYLRWEMHPRVSVTFYPFNFDGEVGDEFNTWDVTRIYSFSGAAAPTNITADQGTQSIEQKTIPGLMTSILVTKNLQISFGGGIASYLYPTNTSFDLSSSTARGVTRWERKQDIGYRFETEYKSPNFLKATLEYVGHTKSEETGSLLAQAGSVRLLMKKNRFYFNNEMTYTKAGKRPYRLARSGTWFEQTTVPQFQPVYATYTTGEPQDWIDQTGHGLATNIGFFINDKTLPYLIIRYQSEHLVYREQESAHRLRDADENVSHGGLSSVGLGAFLTYGKFYVNPEFVVRKAKNNVFQDSSSEQTDRNLATFGDTDFLVTLKVAYSMDKIFPFMP